MPGKGIRSHDANEGEPMRKALTRCTSAGMGFLLLAAAVSGCSGSGVPSAVDVGVQHSAVVNGTTVIATENPNQVAFYRKYDANNWYPRPCTATVLNSEWV